MSIEYRKAVGKGNRGCSIEQAPLKENHVSLALQYYVRHIALSQLVSIKIIYILYICKRFLELSTCSKLAITSSFLYPSNW